MWAAFHDVQPNPYMDGNKRPLSEAKNQRPAEAKRLTPSFSWLSYFSVIIFLCVIFLICFKVLSLRCFQICDRAVFILFRIMQLYLGPNSCKFHSYVGWVTPKSLGPWFRPFSTVRLPLQTLQREQTKVECAWAKPPRSAVCHQFPMTIKTNYHNICGLKQ